MHVCHGVAHQHGDCHCWSWGRNVDNGVLFAVYLTRGACSVGRLTYNRIDNRDEFVYPETKARLRVSAVMCVTADADVPVGQS